MNRIYNVFMWAFALTVMIALTVRLTWADTITMADVAMGEYHSGEREEPLGSDSIKYNEWYYGHAVSNELQENEYVQTYRWNAAFVCWCADQLGYISRNCFPLTNDASDMFHWFEENGYQLYTADNLMASEGRMNVRAGDVVFFPSEENSDTLDVGIVISSDSSGIDYVVGDVEGEIQRFEIDPSHCTENVAFFPAVPAEDYKYAEIIQFLRDRMNLNPAAISGIIANIEYESEGFPEALGDNGTSFGICQWHRSRWQDLINYCNAAGYDWSSLEGQLMFLWYELETVYPDLKSILMDCPSSPDGAFKAGYCFCLTYESPQNSSTQAEFRGAHAMYNVYPSLPR